MPLSRPLLPAVVLLAGLPMLGGCTTSSWSLSSAFSSTPTPPPPPPAQPASIHAEEIVGSWGYAAYQREQDRARTLAKAKGGCSPPYTIDASGNGGVIMLGHDNPQRQEMNLKGSAEGKTYIGPGADPAGADDREVVSFDGKVLVLKWVDPEVAGRYGYMMLVRCEPPKTRTASAKKRAAEAPQ